MKKYLPEALNIIPLAPPLPVLEPALSFLHILPRCVMVLLIFIPTQEIQSPRYVMMLFIPVFLKMNPKTGLRRPFSRFQSQKITDKITVKTKKLQYIAKGIKTIVGLLQSTAPLASWLTSKVVLGVLAGVVHCIIGPAKRIWKRNQLVRHIFERWYITARYVLGNRMKVKTEILFMFELSFLTASSTLFICPSIFNTYWFCAAA